MADQPQPVTREKLINADIDVDNLGKAANELGVVNPRYGDPYKTIPQIAREYEDNGATRGFNTLAEFEAAKSTIPAYSVITIGEVGPNQGQNFWDGITLSKSPFDPLDQVLMQSSNLFDDAASIKENKYIAADGSLVTATSDADWAYTDFIGVTPTKFNYYNGFRYVAFYDKHKNFINRSSISVSDSMYSKPVGVPSNAYYARACYRTSVIDYLGGGRSINAGPTLLDYELGTTQIKKNVYVGNDNFRNRSISPDKLDFIEKSKNLFDASSVVYGSIVSATGTIDSANDYAVSDFIEIESGVRYTLSCDAGYNHFASLAYYDKDKNFISRITTTSTNPFSFISHYAARFVRLNINLNSGMASQRNRMFNLGGVALPYEPYALPKIKGISIDEKAIDGIYEVNALKGRIKKSNNLFNYDAVTFGKVISTTGVINDASDYAISDFIKVIEKAKYTISNDANYSAFVTTAYYDKDKTFLSRVSTASTSGSLTITIPANAAYLRFNINLNSGQPSQRNRMFNFGTVALPYENGGVTLTDVRLGSDVIKQINDEASTASNNATNSLIAFDLPIDNPFYTDAVWNEFADFRNITSDEVYEMYDGLMAQHPLFITKHPLSNNSVGQSIAYYKLKPRIPSVDIASSHKVAKVFLLCGIHGMEHTPPLATFLMLREMYNNWESSALLEALRFNVEFVVLPVANPDGWNKFTRANPNGVDLNRNYSEGWVYRTDAGFYSGESPFSETETQNVRQVFDENTDIDIFYDFHNFNGSSPETHPHIIWVSALSNDKQMARMAQCLTSRMTRHWRREYSFIPAEPYFAGIFDSGPHAGMSASYAKSRGAKLSATFELGNRWWIDPTAVPHDVIHKRTTMEAITNWILISLQQLR